MPSFAAPPRLVHPAAELFPMLADDELTRLADDIARNGLLEPIVVFDGLLLDGRNRRRACEMAGVEPQYVEWRGEGGSPVAFIAARNLHRRHLTESQRATIAARVKGLFEEEAAERQRSRQFGNPFGSPRKNPSTLGASIKKPRKSTVSVNLHTPRGVNARTARMFNVSTSLVALASRVLERGDPLLAEAVDAGQVSVSDAAAVLSLAKEEQRRAVAAVRSGEVRTLRQAAQARRERQEAASCGVPGLPRSVPGSGDAERPSPRRVRRAAKCFEAQCQTLLQYIEQTDTACAGPNDYTRRLRDGLEQLRRLMRQCADDFGRRRQPR